MRIISGKFKGLGIQAPGNLPVRPTTDRAKESLFNILNNEYDFEYVKALDLFSGTGNISYELLSRGCKDVQAIDGNGKCVDFIKSMKVKMQFDGLKVNRSDVFTFLKNCNEKYDIIFADPPYDLQNLKEIPELILQKQLLNDDGVFILEHIKNVSFDNVKGFRNQRDYGQSVFSFFKNEIIE